MTVDEIKKDPDGFARNITQIDGDPSTTGDRSTCVGVSMMGGVILKDPAKAQEMAKKLLGPEGKKQFPQLQNPPASESLKRMAEGKFSPRDASVVGNALIESSRDKGSQGIEIQNEMKLYAKMRAAGIEVPAMQQNVYAQKNASTNGAHAVVEANGKGFDPWPYPGSGGQGTVLPNGPTLDQHAKTTGPRLGLANQSKERMESVRHDGNGGITIERRFVAHPDGKDGVLEFNPPVQARYEFKDNPPRYVRVEPKEVTARERVAAPDVFPG